MKRSTSMTDSGRDTLVFSGLRHPGLIPYEHCLSLGFHASRLALSELQAVLDSAALELAAFRRSSLDYASQARRFHETLQRALVEPEAHPATRASVGAMQEALLSLVEQRVPGYLDRFSEGLSVTIAPALEEAVALQQRLLEALLERRRAAEASDGLSNLQARPEAVMRGLATCSTYYMAAQAYAKRETEAVAGFARILAAARLELLKGLADVSWAHHDDSSRALAIAKAASDAASARAAEQAAQLALAAGAPLPTPATSPTAFEAAGQQLAASGASVADPASPTPCPTTATVLLLGGEAVAVCAKGTRSERTGVLGTLYATNYRLLWVPEWVEVQPAGPPSDSSSSSSSSSRTTPTPTTPTPMPPTTLEAAIPLQRNSQAVRAFSASSSWAAAPEQRESPGAPYTEGAISLPLAALARLEAVGGAVVAVTSDFRAAAFSVTGQPGLAERLVAELAPAVWAKAPSFTKLHAPSSASPGGSAGWALHSLGTLLADFERMQGLWPRGREGRAGAGAGAEPARFRVSAVNSDYAVCSTYPSHIIVPHSLSDAQLVKAAAYRSKGRLPAVVWFSGSVSLSRASQPCSGLLSLTSKDDEHMLGTLGSAVEDREVCRGLGGGAGAAQRPLQQQQQWVSAAALAVAAAAVGWQWWRRRRRTSLCLGM